MDTNSFILALQRFIAHRGNVRFMKSKHESNFVFAAKELSQALKEMFLQFISRDSWSGLDCLGKKPTSS